MQPLPLPLLCLRSLLLLLLLPLLMPLLLLLVRLQLPLLPVVLPWVSVLLHHNFSRPLQRRRCCC